MSKPLITVRIGSAPPSEVRIPPVLPDLASRIEPDPLPAAAAPDPRPTVRRNKRKIRPTSFNLEDAFEAELDRFADGANFSAYVKRLIWHDRQAGGPVLHGSSTLPDLRCHDAMTSNIRDRRSAE